MAEINVERKRNIWPWVIGLIVLLLLIWGAFELLNNDDDVAPIATATAPVVTDPVDPAESMPAPVVAPMPPPPTDADNTVIPVAVIVADPAPYLGQPMMGTATVADVPTDRGFWLEQDGQRMLSVIAQSPNMEDEININAGQQVRLAGVVYDSSLASRIAGQVDAETMAIIADEPAFLLVDARNIVILDR